MRKNENKGGRGAGGGDIITSRRQHLPCLARTQGKRRKTATSLKAQREKDQTLWKRGSQKHTHTNTQGPHYPQSPPNSMLFPHLFSLPGLRFIWSKPSISALLDIPETSETAEA